MVARYDALCGFNCLSYVLPCDIFLKSEIFLNNVILSHEAAHEDSSSRIQECEIILHA